MEAEQFTLDDMDRAILRLLQKDAGLSLAEIAASVGLTATPCWKRIRRMEQVGVIAGRVVLVNAAKVGLPLSVFVSIEIADHSAAWFDRFDTFLAGAPEVVECWRMAGEVDYLLRVLVADMSAYDAFYRRLVEQVPNLRNVTGRFAMERVRATTEVPV